jgi:hypothetical protein
MSEAIHIWMRAVDQPAFRCGGWAAVWRADGRPWGLAGGARGTTAARMALSGLGAALDALTPATAGAGIVIHTDAPDLACVPGVISGAEPAPEENLDLWAAIQRGARGRALVVSSQAMAAGTALAFAAAWADLAMTKAKATGAFRTAIPKANLAKVEGL